MSRPARMILLLLAPIGLLALMVFATERFAPFNAASGRLYLFRNAAWQAAPPVTGSPGKVRIAADSSVWVEARGLARLQDGRWTSYRAADFGTENDWLRGGFTLRGNEVWGALADGAVRFDGVQWRLYPEAVRSKQPASIVAGQSGVWLLDHDGNLSHFDGSRWSSESLAHSLPNVQWGETLDFSNPELALLADGSLWIVFRGLWCRDGSQWARVGEFTNPVVLGSSSDRLWIRERERVSTITAAGQVSALDVGPRRVLAVTAHENSLYLAATDGLIILNSGRMERVPAPDANHAVTSVAVAPDGTVWATTDAHVSATAMLLRSLPVLLLGLGALSLMPQLLRAAAGIPTSASPALRSMAWKIPGLLVGLCVGTTVLAVAGLRILPRIWPHAPSWALTAFVLAGVVAAFTLWKWAHRPPGPEFPSATNEQPKPMAKRIVAASRAAIPVLLLFLLEQGPLKWAVEWIHHVVKNPTLAMFVIFAAGMVLVMLLFAAPQILSFGFMYHALRRGDYQRALWWTDLLDLNREFRHDVLLLAGRAAEAEASARATLSKRQSPRMRALDLDALGEALTDLGRFADARATLEESVAVDVGPGGALNNLAELYLRQGIELRKALELIDRAVAAKVALPMGKRMDRHQGAVRLANRAWAFALLGRRREAEQSIAEARQAAVPGFLPVLAGVHWRIGMTWLALGQFTEARKEFQAAETLDPRGKYGRLGQQGIASAHVPG